MAGLSKSLSPSVVKTALDKVFYQEWDMEKQAGFVDATSPLVFMQERTDRDAEVEEVYKPPKIWTAHGERESVEEDTPRVANQKTHSVVNYRKTIPVSKNFFDDEKWSVVRNTISQMAVKAKLARDLNAFNTFSLGNTTYTTADSANIFSNSHTTFSGATVDNLDTAALSEASLNTGIIALGEQLDQAGDVMGVVPRTLLVPLPLFKTACIIVDSELRSGTANNDDNIYSSKYGIYVATSRLLGDITTNGSDTAWYLLGSRHGMTRWVREEIITETVDWKYQDNFDYLYKGEFREMVGATDYVGLWKSTGAA